MLGVAHLGFEALDISCGNATAHGMPVTRGTPLHATPTQLAYICDRFFTVSIGQLTSYMFTYHTAVKYDVARVRLTYHIQRHSRMQKLFATFMQQGGLVGKVALAVMAYYKVYTNKSFHIMALFEDMLFAQYGCSSFSPRVNARVVSRECFHNPVLCNQAIFGTAVSAHSCLTPAQQTRQCKSSPSWLSDTSIRHFKKATAPGLLALLTSSSCGYNQHRPRLEPVRIYVDIVLNDVKR